MRLWCATATARRVPIHCGEQTELEDATRPLLIQVVSWVGMPKGRGAVLQHVPTAPSLDLLEGSGNIRRGL